MKNRDKCNVEKIIILKYGIQSSSAATESPKEITNVEESILSMLQVMFLLH